MIAMIVLCKQQKQPAQPAAPARVWWTNID